MKHRLSAVLIAAALLSIMPMSVYDANAGHRYAYSGFYYSAPPSYYMTPPVYYHPSVFAPPATFLVPASQPQYYAPAPAYYPAAPAPAYAPGWFPARSFEVEYDWNPWRGVWEVEYDFD